MQAQWYFMVQPWQVLFWQHLGHFAKGYGAAVAADRGAAGVFMEILGQHEKLRLMIGIGVVLLEVIVCVSVCSTTINSDKVSFFLTTAYGSCMET